jgi:hypothetical protein
MAAINRPLGQARTGLSFRTPAGRVSWWLVAAVAVLGLSAMLPVLQNSSATSQAFETRDLRAQRDALNGDVNLLEADIARLTSLVRIERRAADIGLAPATSQVFVTVGEPGPAPAKIPAEYLPAPAAPGGRSAPWWQSLLRRLPLPD